MGPPPAWPDEEQFFARIEQGLRRFPQLQARVPSGYPRAGRYQVSRKVALEFEEVRTSRYPHNINLPLALYLAGSDDVRRGAQKFMVQMLSEVEVFLEAFGGTAGVSRVVEPLWSSSWDTNDPSMWSVLAHANMAQHLRHQGAIIRAFESPTGQGNASADIDFEHEGIRAMLDVEMWHAASGRTLDEVRQNAVRRAEAKAASKFQRLNPGVRGFVSEFCFAMDEQFSLITQGHSVLTSFELEQTSNCAGQLYMILGLGDAKGQIEGYRIISAESSIPPEPSSTLRSP